jgi:hypothetical protein
MILPNNKILGQLRGIVLCEVVEEDGGDDKYSITCGFPVKRYSPSETESCAHLQLKYFKRKDGTRTVVEKTKND